MTTPASIPTETILRKEWQLFKELLPRLMNALINWLFDLSPEMARNRMSFLIIIFVISGSLISFNNKEYSLLKWSDQFESIFSYLLNTTRTQENDTVMGFILFIWRAYTNPHTLQYLPIILATFFIALHFAGLYLADVFELNDISVARQFIWAVALSGSDETIRITKGDILDENLDSPAYLIGGPGKVIVDLDSVALFEKPDGTLHIIGPTGKEKGGKATLDGFERLRQTIDIRDHYVDLRDQNEKSSSVKSRSLDGIPITATDVRLMFSVHRGGKKSSSDEPYPFSRKAVEKLVYSAGSRVTPDQPTPSAFEFSWINNMIGLIRGKLGGFMSERNLTLYLASIGQPEIEKDKQRKEAFANDELLTTLVTEDASKDKDKDKKTEFTPRYKITNLFAQFTEEFTKSASDRGVELHWIGIGTWRLPTEIVPETKVVPEKHLEAWKLSQENQKRGSGKALEQLEKETILLKIMFMIQDVPIRSYNNKVLITDDRKDAMRILLLDYRQQLIEIAELMKANGESVSPTIKQAIANLDSILRLRWISPS